MTQCVCVFVRIYEFSEASALRFQENSEIYVCIMIHTTATGNEETFH